MTTATRSKDSPAQVKLSSHDVNVISVIAQQKASLPRVFLLNYAKTSCISSDAVEIVELLLNDSLTVSKDSASSADKTAKMNIVNEFQRWESQLGRR